MHFKNTIEESDTKEILNSEYINWEFYTHSAVLVTGATGLIGCQTVLALLYANEMLGTDMTIYALVRNREKAEKIFKDNYSDKLQFIVQDITQKIECPHADFIIHAANGTASKDFVEKPVETINSIVFGTKNILDFAKESKAKGVIYLSTMEVYGNIPLTRTEPLQEDDYGYMDILKIRNSYPLGKKLAENLCRSYYSEYKVPVKIARLAQTIGAGVNYNDNRVFAQFARNIAEKQDIILRTKGETIRSYCYITDCIAAILVMLQKGKEGECYNIANPDTTCSIYDMAKMLVDKYPASKLKIELEESLYPQTTKYYLGTTKYYLDTAKYYRDTSWKAKVSLETMFERLINSFAITKKIEKS